MAKKKTLFECQACGFQSPRWMGKCTSCDQWETMIELTADQIKKGINVEFEDRIILATFLHKNLDHLTTYNIKHFNHKKAILPNELRKIMRK